MPMLPEPANNSNTVDSSSIDPIILKIASLILSPVGLTLFPSGAYNFLPLFVPDIILIRTSFYFIYQLNTIVSSLNKFIISIFKF